jgi:HSP20 family protein
MAKSFFERLVGKSKDEEKKLPVRNDMEKEIEEMAEEEEGELAIDMYQTPDDIIVKTMVAGVKPEDLDITITRDMVSIKGKREESQDYSDDDFFHKELYWGAFSRTVVLPQEIEVEEAEATNKNGLLTIRLPKLDKNKQAKVKVKSV